VDLLHAVGKTVGEIHREHAVGPPRGLHHPPGFRLGDGQGLLAEDRHPPVQGLDRLLGVPGAGGRDDHAVQLEIQEIIKGGALRNTGSQRTGCGGVGRGEVGDAGHLD